MLALFSCHRAGDTPERIARDICGCMSPLARQQESLEAAVERNDLEMLRGYTEEMERVMSKCGAEIEKKYGPLKGELGEQVRQAMQRACPELVATLNKVESAFVK